MHYKDKVGQIQKNYAVWEKKNNSKYFFADTKNT